MTTMRAFFLLALLAAGFSSPAAASPVIADVQVVQTSRQSWIVRVRASEPQGFDVLTETPVYAVRLHRATLARTRATLPRVPFGRVALAARRQGVDLSLRLPNGYRAETVQGASADVVEVRVTRSP